MITATQPQPHAAVHGPTAGDGGTLHDSILKLAVPMAPLLSKHLGIMPMINIVENGSLQMVASLADAQHIADESRDAFWEGFACGAEGGLSRIVVHHKPGVTRVFLPCPAFHEECYWLLPSGRVATSEQLNERLYRDRDWSCAGVVLLDHMAIFRFLCHHFLLAGLGRPGCAPVDCADRQALTAFWKGYVRAWFAKLRLQPYYGDVDLLAGWGVSLFAGAGPEAIRVLKDYAGGIGVPRLVPRCKPDVAAGLLAAMDVERGPLEELNIFGMLLGHGACAAAVFTGRPERSAWLAGLEEQAVASFARQAGFGRYQGLGLLESSSIKHRTRRKLPFSILYGPAERKAQLRILAAALGRHYCRETVLFMDCQEMYSVKTGFGDTQTGEARRIGTFSMGLFGHCLSTVAEGNLAILSLTEEPDQSLACASAQEKAESLTLRAMLDTCVATGGDFYMAWKAAGTGPLGHAEALQGRIAEFLRAR